MNELKNLTPYEDYTYPIDEAESWDIYEYYLAEESAKYFYTENKGHDKLFKEVLKDKTNFIDFIKEFVNETLGKELTEENIEIYDRKFITSNFTEIESDIIYKVKNKALYFIVEQQSTVDKNMSYRMLQYMAEIIKEHMQNEKAKKYPKIIPIVINTSNKSWKYKVQRKRRKSKWNK